MPFYPPRDLPVLAVSIQDAVKLSGLSRTTIADLIKTGELPSKKVGVKVLIPVEAIKRLVGVVP
jgi:excisionase family DNA binding protein